MVYVSIDHFGLFLINQLSIRYTLDKYILLTIGYIFTHEMTIISNFETPISYKIGGEHL